MEQHELKAILDALKVFSDKIDERFDSLEQRMDRMENKMDTRFERQEKKLDGLRVEITETQETVDYLSSKSLQHDKKLRSILVKED